MRRILVTVLSAPLFLMAEEGGDKLWSVHVELSYVRTSGNVETQTFSEKAEVKREGRVNRLYLKNSALYATQEERETANRMNVDLRWERLFTERSFAFLTGGYQRDRFSGYAYRWSGGPGLGYDFIRSERHELKGLVSLLYYYNRIEEGGIDNYGTMKAETYYQWNIAENLRFKESVSYIVDLADRETYFLNSETSLEVRINNIMSLGVGYRIAYQNKPPAADVKRVDTTFSTSLIIDL